MSRARSAHLCRSCGVTTPRWAGRCPGCGAWNSLVEEPLAAALARSGARGAPATVPLAEVDLSASEPGPTGVDELDRVLGGGLVPGSVTVLGGEPGVGKSTLLLQVLLARAGRGEPCLLVCAEESAPQVRLRAERLGPLPPALHVVADTGLSSVPLAVRQLGARLVVVDSIQAVRHPDTPGPAGSLSQVRACTEQMVALAKAGGVPVVLVGHVTKDGALAGPRHLEHAVDTVLSVEGDRHHALRTLRAVKHRFGPTGELGLFEMGESGLAAVSDPHRLLLGDRRPGQPGSSVLPALEGRRSLLVEVQALVTDAGSRSYGPRRQVQGLDAGRVAQLVAAAGRQLGAGLATRDVFASVVGGVRVAEPAADLAVVLSLLSAAWRQPLPADVVVFGEVGLGGEVRQVPEARRRLEEAARLGFERAVVPASCCDGPDAVSLVRIGVVGELAALFDQAGAQGPRRGEVGRKVSAGTIASWRSA